MAAINATYTNEVPQSHWQRHRRGSTEMRVETTFRTTNHNSRTNHHHYVQVNTPGNLGNEGNRQLNGWEVRRTSSAETVHQIEQLVSNVRSGQRRHGLPEPALFLSPMGEET